jgi:hypothetical protein
MRPMTTGELTSDAGNAALLAAQRSQLIGSIV